MEEKRLRYPLNVQSFEDLRTEGFVYIDKTEYIYDMTHGDSSYTFLSRPRRFGKSLLASTLHYYFAGRKDLFKGLAIEKLEKEWTAYPVLHFDFSKVHIIDNTSILENIDSQLRTYEQQYGRETESSNPSVRLGNLIKRVYDQTAKKVVIIVDEYDAPMLDVIHKKTELEEVRNVMRNFFSPLKAYSENLRFVFLTGITKFAQLTIFSELNNLVDISMDEAFAGICGITEEELTGCLKDGISRLALKYKVEEREMAERLKKKYDGYHFTWPSPDLYNPVSLFNALSRETLRNFWFSTGTAAFLIKLLKEYHIAPQHFDNLQFKASSFDTSIEHTTSPIPVLYQGGYLTIKAYDEDIDLYTLGIPNEEVRIGLIKNLLPEYVGNSNDSGLSTIAILSRKLKEDDIDGVLRGIQQYLLTVPYTNNASSEGHYQQMLYLIFSLLGEYVDIEVHTPRGRVDMVIRTDTRLYLIELKLDKSAGAAMQQINLKDYASAFALSGLPVTKVGVNFDSSKRTISDWEIQQ